MATTELAVIEQRIAPEGHALVAQAHAFVIADAASMEAVAEHRRACKAYRDKVAEHLDPIRAAQHAAWKLTVAKIDELCAPALRAESIDGKKLAAWDAEQTWIRNEALAAQARERERLEAAERQRVADETTRLRREAEDRRLEAAAAAEARGDAVTAERIVSAPIVVEAPAPKPVFVPPAAVPEYTRPEGTSFSTTWQATLLSLHDLIQGVIEGKVAGGVALQLLAFNGHGANAFARHTKDAVKVPGVKFQSVRTTVQK